MIEEILNLIKEIKEIIGKEFEYMTVQSWTDKSLIEIYIKDENIKNNIEKYSSLINLIEKYEKIKEIKFEYDFEIDNVKIEINLERRLENIKGVEK